MEENGILNVYKLNLYQVLNFMFRVHNQTIPKSFQIKFQYIEQKYETRQSKDNFIIPKRNTQITRFATSSRGPRICHSLINNPTKTIYFYPLFKSTIKENLLKLNAAFFNIPVCLSFSFVFSVENNFFSRESIINKFHEIRPKVTDDKTDEPSAGLLRIDLNL